MLETKEIISWIDAEVQKLNLSSDPQNLYEPIEYILSLGGKRARPVLLMLSYQLFDDKLNKALPAALAIELFHNFTLLHDDLMDHAEVRRNKPTVHKKWNANVAILSGDAMLIKAYEMLAKTDQQYIVEVYHEFNKVALEVCEGQQYDMEFESRLDVTEDEYIEMIRLKTAVLLASSIKIGAILGHASAQEKEALYQMALNAGIGFQLMDDYLDTFGDPAVFGKKIGGDILENKKTFLLINALKQAKADTAEQLNKLLETTDQPELKIKEVKAIYNALDIGKQTLDKSQEYFNKSATQLAALSLPEEPKRILSAFLDALTQRKK